MQHVIAKIRLERHIGVSLLIWCCSWEHIRSDVYGFGVILWEIVTEKIPWDNLNSMQLLLSCVDKPLKIYSCATSNDSKA